MKSNNRIKKLFVSDKSFILIKRLYKVVYECLEVRLNITSPIFQDFAESDRYISPVQSEATRRVKEIKSK